MSKHCCKLSVLSIGIAFGLMWSLGMLFLGIAAWQTGWGDKMVEVMASLYLGYKATLVGSFIGAAWGFADAFIGGVIFAWLYNLCLCMCRSKCNPTNNCH